MDKTLVGFLAAALLLPWSQQARSGMCDSIRPLAEMAPSGFESIEEAGSEGESRPATRSLPGADECTVDGQEEYSCLWNGVSDPAERAARLGQEIHACFPGSTLQALDLLGMHVIATDDARISVLGGMEDQVILITIQKAPDSQPRAAAQPASAPSSTATPSASSDQDDLIDFGETIRGRIERSDPALADESHYDEYRFSGRAGEHILITMLSGEFTPFVTLRRRVNGVSEYVPDEKPSYDDEKVDRTLPETGEYIIRAGTLASDVIGDYTLELKR
ncbi:MAG: hypothetical protein NT117_06210 [Gammaproteobacteria bacterium]|nr:hypothetical protein [Gammaproteobacteria bacterium]